MYRRMQSPSSTYKTGSQWHKTDRIGGRSKYGAMCHMKERGTTKNLVLM
jgi:hypothetical protein